MVQPILVAQTKEESPLVNITFVRLSMSIFIDQLVVHAGKIVERHPAYHESLENLTPADVFYGRGQEILDQMEAIKRNTLAIR